MLHWLGIKPSYSRPRVSDDNAYAEALFRTAKYRPEFPARLRGSGAARAWASRFVHWYNVEHRHSGIRYVARPSVTPAPIRPFWPHVTRCMSRLASATQRAGHATPATGLLPAR